MEGRIVKRGTIAGSKKQAHSIAFRKKVIEYYTASDGRSLAETAKEFKLSLNSVKTIWRTRSKLRKQNEDDKRLKVRTPHHAELEKDVLLFIKLARSNRLPVTGEIIQTKASLLRAKHNLTDESFQANQDSVRDEMIAFCQQLSRYEPQHIYNQDESGLVYQLLPNVSYLAPEEDRKDARGVKAMRSKNRITFTMCTNADGSHILDCMVISKAKKPNAFFSSRAWG
eukprot:IDg9219t1